MNHIDKFTLIKPLGGLKPGKIFDSFGGLVSGIDGISFSNTEYFRRVKRK